MTQHLNEGSLYALLDDEMSPAEEREARAHLAVCELCSGALAEVRASSEVLSKGLGLLDRPMSPRRFVAPPPQPAAPAPARQAWWKGASLGRAAAIVLVVGAAASATVPGSPIREWLEPEEQSLPVAITSTPPAPESAPSAAASVVESGVGVEPDLGVLRMTIVGAIPGLRVTALITDSPRGGVFGVGGDGSGRFLTSPGSVVVTDARMEELRIEIPRSAMDASVTINGRRYLTKEGDQLRLTVDGSLAPVQSFAVDR